MSTIAVVFESTYGQTKKIAERVAEIARSRGHRASVMRVTGVRAEDLESADAVAVLSPVYNRKHTESVRDFLVARRALLRSRPTAFFSVSLGAGIKQGFMFKPGQARREMMKIVRDFLAATGFQPAVVVTVGGALAYPSYEPGFRLLMKIGCLLFGLPTDTSRVHEFTDWSEVERATTDLLAQIEPVQPRAAAAAPLPAT